MSYYTYNEEIRDEDVPEEVILKKHHLPYLPEEVRDMILYKFGGLQHKVAPMLKMLRELTFKTYDRVLPIENYSSYLRLRYQVAKEVSDKKFFKLNYRRTETTTIYRSVIYGLVGHIANIRYNGKLLPDESYTYEDPKYVFSGEPRVGNSNIKYKNASVEQIVKYWKRHLVSKIMSLKQLKELLDINKIFYPKSSSKKKLLEVWYKN